MKRYVTYFYPVIFAFNLLAGYLHSASFAPMQNRMLGNLILYAAVVVLSLPLLCFSCRDFFKNAIWMKWTYADVFLIGSWSIAHAVFLYSVLCGETQVFFAGNLILYDCLIIDSLYLIRTAYEEMKKGLTLVIWMVFATAVYGIYEFIFTGTNFLPMVTNPYRICSFYRNPIPAGSIFLIGLWMAEFLIMGIKRWQKNLVRGVFVIAILMTNTRSVWMGLLFGIILFFAIERKRNPQNRAMWTKRKIGICIGVGAVLLAVFFVALLLNESARATFLSRFSNVSESQPYIVRTTRIRYMIRHFFGKAGILEWIFGNGYGASALWVQEHVPFEYLQGYYMMDNSYLMIWCEMGLLGIISLGIIVKRIICLLQRTANGRNDELHHAAAIVCGMILVPFFFYDVQLWPRVLVLFIPILMIVLVDRSNVVPVV